MEEALHLLSDIALRPDFPEEHVVQQQATHRGYLDRFRQSAVSTGNEQYWRAVYGDTHPYGRSYYGTVQGLRAINRDHVIAHHASAFQPSNAALLITGAVDADAIRLHVSQTFSNGWPTGRVLPTPPIAESAVTPRSVYLIDRPGLVQSFIRVSAEAPPRSSPDYYALDVLNMIFGGATSSRLGVRLNEETGFTYEARSLLNSLRTGGTFVAYANVETSTTASALELFIREIERVTELSQADLETAQNVLALQYTEPFSAVFGINPVLDQTFIHGLPIEHFNRYEDQIRDVTLRDLHRVAKRYLTLDRMSFTVVGDLDSIEDDIRDLAIGPVTILTADDIWGPARG
ncbi:MAG: pitrilysin family protein [Bacteroidota bacterium]